MIDWQTDTFEANPQATDLVGQTYAFIQTTRVAVGERLRVEHDMDDSHGTSGQGVHNMGSARGFIYDKDTALPAGPTIVPTYVLADGVSKGRIAFKRYDAVLDGSNRIFHKIFVYYKDADGEAWTEPSYVHLGDIDETAYGLKTFFEWPVVSDITGVAKDTPYSTHAAATKTLIPIASLEARLEAFQETMLAAVLPVGFVYVQYPGSGTPTNLWGAVFGALWTEQSYDGAFFRATGTGADAFDAPMQAAGIIEHTHTPAYPAGYGVISLTSGGVDPKADDGSGAGFNISAALPTIANYGGTETRPKNRTIRIWKRTA